MLDVLKSLDITYVCANPGSSFDSLHESVINYGGNKMPEFLTCCHEEAAVAMGHGYFKIEGKPIMMLLEGAVGLQHASMAIYNAYADRVPVYIVVGNYADDLRRAPGAETYHSGIDLGGLVRDYVKWDDQPYSLGHFANSAVRAYKIAMSAPMGPVLLVANHEIQSAPQNEPRLRIPKLTLTTPPAGDMAAIAEAAKMLVNAERPMILTERAVRTPAGLGLIVQLAEALQAPVETPERMEFPNRHPLAGTGGPGYKPDLTLCLEVSDLMSVAREARASNAKVIHISAVTLQHKSNLQEFGHYADIDLDIGADVEATLPYLIEAVNKLINSDRRRALDDRGAKLREIHHNERNRHIADAAYGWDLTPISTGRLCAELWPLIQNEDWSLVSPYNFVRQWPRYLWNIDKSYQYIGRQGAGGLGYGAPAACGAALANRKYGRLSINIQTDGDLNYCPGVLWTAAHHNIPLLTIMHNNRAYHAEVMFIQEQCAKHDHGPDRAYIGTTITHPNIDYAQMANAYGLYGEGPITDPKDVAPALKRGIERVKKGEPALIDVVTQPR